jgi:hypothetical protein
LLNPGYVDHIVIHDLSPYSNVDTVIIEPNIFHTIPATVMRTVAPQKFRRLVISFAVRLARAEFERIQGLYPWKSIDEFMSRHWGTAIVVVHLESDIGIGWDPRKEFSDLLPLCAHHDMIHIYPVDSDKWRALDKEINYKHYSLSKPFYPVSILI